MGTGGQFESRYLGRMTAMLQSAFDQACAEGDLSIAEELAGVLETVLTRAADRDEHRDRCMSVLQSVFGRMWETRQAIQARAGTDCAPARHLGAAVEAYDAYHVVRSEARQVF